MKMVNPNLIKLAKRQMNKEVPAERVSQREEKSESELTQILERDKDGKPKLDLTPIEETVIHALTKEQYDTLMQVYECGGWRWCNEALPTKDGSMFWSKYKKETCVNTGSYFSNHKQKRFAFNNKKFYQNKDWNILTPKQFYDTQNVTPEMINEINVWFDENGKS